MVSPSTATRAFGPTLKAGVATVRPSTATRPATIQRSASRREQSPARANRLASRSSPDGDAVAFFDGLTMITAMYASAVTVAMAELSPAHADNGRDLGVNPEFGRQQVRVAEPVVTRRINIAAETVDAGPILGRPALARRMEVVQHHGATRHQQLGRIGRRVIEPFAAAATRSLQAKRSNPAACPS